MIILANSVKFFIQNKGFKGKKMDKVLKEFAKGTIPPHYTIQGPILTNF